jgi:hypothetical protein
MAVQPDSKQRSRVLGSDGARWGVGWEKTMDTAEAVKKYIDDVCSLVLRSKERGDFDTYTPKELVDEVIPDIAWKCWISARHYGHLGGHHCFRSFVEQAIEAGKAVLTKEQPQD